jgi:phosphinothricin acetyltransferase
MKLIMRLAAIQDTEQILEIYSPYVLDTDISFETAVPSKEEMEKRIESVLSNKPWIVIEDEKHILGYAYASEHNERSAYRWSVDLSVYIRQDSRGMGLGKALYTALFHILKLQGYCNAYAIIVLPNESSIGIHEYFGSVKVAHYNNVGYKLGNWHDVGCWELFLAQHDPEPSEPLSISSIDETDLFKAFEKGMQMIKSCR